MSRLFTSDVDRKLYGEKFVEMMKTFYDKVDLLQLRYKMELPEGISLDDTFGFHIQGQQQGIEFNDKYDLPQHIMNEIFKEFQAVFQK